MQRLSTPAVGLAVGILFDLYGVGVEGRRGGEYGFYIMRGFVESAGAIRVFLNVPGREGAITGTFSYFFHP